MPCVLGVCVGLRFRWTYDWHVIILVLAATLMVYPPLQMLTIGDTATLVVFVGFWLVGVFLVGMELGTLVRGPRIRRPALA